MEDTIEKVIVEKKDITKIVNDVLKEENSFEEKIDIKELVTRLNKIEEENKKLKDKIEYNDSNLKANYISTLLGMLFLTMSYVFDFSSYLKISNLFSSIIFITIISIFFFKENNIIVKKIFKIFV